MHKIPLLGSWFFVACHVSIAFMLQFIFNLIMKHNNNVIFSLYLVMLIVFLFDKQSRFVLAFKRDPASVLSELYNIAFKKDK